MRLRALTLLSAVVLGAAGAIAGPAADARIQDLLGRMTLGEKIGQLNFLSRGEPDGRQPAEVRAGRVGAVLNVLDPREVTAFRKAAAASRLGIPLIFGLDAVNVFRIAMPSPLGWAATWDVGIAARAAEMVGREAAAAGIDWTFAPMVDLTRDPRWGRVIEGGGEDPVLASAMARARVSGYRAGGVATTAKHFVGYGAAEAGRDYNGATIPLSELLDRYLPPFRAAIAAGSETVMAAFNTVNGEPVTASSTLLRGVLRERLGFDGVVTSDYNAIGELASHGVARDRGEAARKALAAGIDLDMEGTAYIGHLEAELAAGRLDMPRLDAAVARVLKLKFRLGLFDRAPDAPFPPPPAEADVRAAAREAARQSLVLLKNDSDVLPIAPSARRIAVIGRAADADYDMSWWGPAQLTKPETETLTAALGRLLRPGQTMTYVPATRDPCGRTFEDKNAAVAAARAADIAVVLVAEDCEAFGEGASRAHLDLTGVQQELIEAVAATGTPVVLVVDTGRPLVLTKAAPFAKAILVAWQGGTEGRTALAETLTGDSNPSGKLPMSFPRAVGQLPMSYDALPTSRPPGHDRFTSRYVDEDVKPLFPFGHGLSYTRFAFTGLKLASPEVAPGGTLEVTAMVTNTGSRRGREVAQLYVRQLVASRSRPVRQLKAFTKVSLAPGETHTLSFRVPAAELGFHDDTGAFHIEPGPFQLWLGGTSEATLTAHFEVIAGGTGGARARAPVPEAASAK
jgi:beta-glucosidase